MIGRTIGHYHILALIGRGGMGEVYRAHDTRLKRDVALKVLAADVAEDPARLERFQREAETVAILNHSRIITVFSVEEVDGLHFLTMELVEGRTLNAVLSSGGLPLAKLFEIGIAMADALAEEIIRRAWGMLAPGGHMVMLLRMAFQTGVDRYNNLWSQLDPHTVGLCSRRPSFYGGGTNRTEFCVFYWAKGLG